MRISSGIQGELDLINQIFADNDAAEDSVLDAAESLYKSGEKDIYARLIHVMCHLRLPPAEAKQTWEAIINHRDALEEKLGRKAGFRVAMVDYFVNESHELKNPKVIEIHVYAETARQAAVDELTGVFNRRFFDAAIEERQNKIAAERGFTVREHALYLYVECLKTDCPNKPAATGHSAGDVIR